MTYTAHGYFLDVSIETSGKVENSMRFELIAASDAAAVTSAASLIAKLEPLTDGYIARYAIRKVYTNDSAGPGGGFGSIKAQLSLQLTTPGKKAAMAIPAPVDALFAGGFGTAGFNTIDTSNTDLNSFIDDFGVGAHGYVSDHENVISPSGLIAGVRVSRSRRLG